MVQGIDFKKSAMLLMLTLTLVGCQPVGPDFQAPEATSVATHYRLAGQALVPQPTPLADAWWHQLHSATVDALVAQALAHNQDIAVAQAHLRQAHALLRAAGGDMYPQLSLQANAGRARYGAEFLGPMPKPPAFNYFAIGPAISYTLDYTGALKRSLEEQQAQTQYAVQQLRAVSLDIAGQTLLTLLRLAQLHDTALLLGQLQADAEARQQFWMRAVAAGGASTQQLDAVEMQTVAATQDLLRLQHEYTSTLVALAPLLGISPEAVQDPKLSLQALQLPQSMPVSLPSELLHQRPDICAAEAQLHAATAAVGVASARLYPQIVLQANFSQEATDPGHLWSAASASWGLGAGLTQPIFNRTRLQQEKEAAKAVLQARWGEYRKTVVHAFTEVSVVLQHLDNDQKQLSSQTLLENISRRRVHAEEQATQQGGSTSLATLEATDQVRQVQLQGINAQTALFSDIVRLYLALGAEPDVLHPSTTKGY